MNLIGIALAAYKPNLKNFYSQLKSIQNQSYTNWICVVTFDEGYDDFIYSERFSELLNDIRFIFKKNASRLGHKKNFEEATQQLLRQKIKPNYISFSDQDDIWYSTKLKDLLDCLIQNPNKSMVHSNMHILDDINSIEKIRMDENGLKVLGWNIEARNVKHDKPQDFIIRNIVAGAALMTKIELVEKNLEIPDAFNYHDYWYASLASIHGGICHMDTPLFAYRQHGENVVGISPYLGFFHLRNRTNIIKKSKSSFEKSKEIYTTLSKFYKFSKFDEICFSKKYDLGIIYIIKSFVYFITHDKPSSRAALVKAIGKLFSLIT